MDDTLSAPQRQALAASIRANTLCGQCQSATLIGWPSGQLEREDMPRGAAYDSVSKHWYLVRCDYFKMTVPHPGQMAFCEAHKATVGANAGKSAAEKSPPKSKP